MTRALPALLTMLVCVVLLAARTSPAQDAPTGVVAPGVRVVELAGDFRFTEGPARNAKGDVYFSDIPASRMYKWSSEGGVSLVRENTARGNGLAFDAAGNLLVCETANRRIVSIDAAGKVSVVADRCGGQRFNQTNDLWIDPRGGVYLSDPMYGSKPKTPSDEHVYYVTPGRKQVIRVTSDLVRPNGLVGTPDGKTLYVGDHAGGKTYRYAVNDDGTLRDKTLFAPLGSDGMTIDGDGNVYMTTDAVVVYNAAGRQIARIEVPQQPTNLCFAGKDGRTLVITAGTALYAVETTRSGVNNGPTSRPICPSEESP